MDVHYIIGSHTGKRILDLYEQIATQYSITNKVNFIITDNASNMKAAFSTRFPISTHNIPDDPTDNDDLWSGETEDDSAACIDGERLSCFAHTLQLSVGDGLRETKSISLAMSKGVKLAGTLHKSTIYKVSAYYKDWPAASTLCHFLIAD